MFPSSITQFPDEQKPLMWSSISYMSGLKDHVNVVEGPYPQASAGTDGVV
jgi:hypothetical protein